MSPEPLTRTGLARELVRAHGLTRAEAVQVVSRVLDSLEQALCDGHRVELRGLGSFRPRHHSGYTRVDPISGERRRVEPRVSLAYRPSSSLRMRLNTLEERT